MTRQTADAILDWMDSDDDPSEFGAETAYYAAQQPAYRPKQSRLECLDELLLVRGVTRELLYGEDANGNGVLDANENDGSRSDPPDNADSLLQRGWLDFMTLVSAECNLRPDGSAKINVNHPNLVELFDVLQREFGTDVARFIVAWRLTGSLSGAEDQRLNNPLAGTLVPATIDPNENFDLFEAEKNSARRRVKKPLGNDDEPPDLGSVGVVEKPGSGSNRSGTEILRGGLNLSRSPAYAIRSLLDLIGTDVRIVMDRKDVVLHSPWKADGALERALLELDRKLTTTDAPVIAGRININLAPREVLLTIPGLTETQVTAIAAAQANGNGQASIAERKQTIAWLLTEGILDLRHLRQVAPYITTRGDVWRGVSVGHLPEAPVVVGVEFLLDASVRPSRVRAWRDLPPWPAARRD